MIQIKVLGTGCPKCKTTYNNVLTALEKTGKTAEVIKVEDIAEIMKYDVLSTPALVINEVIKVKGKVPEVAEIIEFLTNNSVTNTNDCCCSDSGCC